MQKPIFPIAALLAVLAAFPAMAAPPPPNIADIDLPQDKPQHASVFVREFPVGGSSGWHVHPGVEVGYLLNGEMTLEEEGKPVRRLLPGDGFAVPRGVPHVGVNVGREPARLVITYLLDKDAPSRVPVPAPHGH